MIRKKVSSVEYIYKVIATGEVKRWYSNPEHPGAIEIQNGIWSGKYILVSTSSTGSQSGTPSGRTNSD